MRPQIAGYTMRKLRQRIRSPATYRDIMRLCHEHYTSTGQYINAGQTVTRLYTNKPVRVGDYVLEPIPAAPTPGATPD